MNELRARRAAPPVEVISTIARWVLGGLFLYMGLRKALDPVEFLKLVRQYEMMHNPFVLNSIAAALPWFEAFCGVLLLMGVAVRGAALMLLCMLAPFTAIILRRALGISALQHIPLCAVQFNCGCGAGVVWICRKLVENCGLIVLAVWLLMARAGRLSLRYSVLGNKSADDAPGVAPVSSGPVPAEPRS